MSVLGAMRPLRLLVRIRRRQRGPLRPSWDERFETFARFLHHYGKRSYVLPLRLQRAMLGVAPRSPAIDRMQFEDVDANGVRARWFRWDGGDPARVILYLHGGGYCLGSIDSHRDLIARLSIASGATALAIDYRLAPEHRFPAQLDDTRGAYRWLLARGVDPSRIVIAGDSAGGGLALSTLVALRDEGARLPAAAVTFSPWVDLEASGETMLENLRYDYVAPRSLRIFAGHLMGDGDLRNPLAAPLYADLRGLPPLLLQAGAVETLLDDARRFAERARAADVDVTLDVADDMIHVWQVFAAFLAPAQAALGRAGDFIHAHTG